MKLYFYLNKNNIFRMAITKDDFINFMNNLYHLSLSDLLTLQRINTYKTKYNKRLRIRMERSQTLL